MLAGMTTGAGRLAALALRPSLALLSALLLAGAVWAADDDDLQAMTRRVLAQAEVLGLPSLEGATLYQGPLTSAGQDQDELLAARSVRHVHAKRPDGSWLVDLVVATMADALDPEELSALTPFIPGSPEPEPPPGGRYAPTPDTLGQARLIAVGVPEARAHFPPVNPLRRELDWYPRQDWPSDPELALRLACRDYFLAHDQRDAAIAIVPPAWRAAVQRKSEHHAPPNPLPAGAAGLVAGYHVPKGFGFPSVDTPPLPEIDDGTLVSLANDRTAALMGCTVGEVGLRLLGERWGFDPALLAGRDPACPWDDAEQDAVAAGLAAWWQRTAGMTLASRWVAVLSTLPLDRAITAIRQREEGMTTRRFIARDRVLNHTWQGTTAPVIPPEDAQDLLDEITALTLTRWEHRATPPDDLTDRGVLLFLGEVDGSRSFSGSTPSEVQGALMQRAGALKARFLPLVATWPRQGALAEPLAMWDDDHGHPEGLDALVHAQLATPGLTSTKRRYALQLWLRRCTEPRWHLLQEMLGRPCDDPDWQALAALAADPFTGRCPYSGTDGETLILWSLLQDNRPLPDGVLPDRLPHAHDASVAACLTAHLARSLNPYSYPRPTADDMKTIRAIRQPGATPEVIAAAVRALSRTYAPRAADLAKEMKIPLPAGLAPSPTQTASVVVPSGPPVLTADEASAITAALAEARALGFPDLAGAKVFVGELPSNDGAWYGVHLRLASGSWLANGTHAVDQADAGANPDWLVPQDAGPMRAAHRMPRADQARLGRVNLDRISEYGTDLVLPALAWWLSGDDRDGGGILAAVMSEALRRHDIANTWSIAPGSRGEDRGALVAVPSIPDGVRRSLARWFREQLVWAADAVAADHALAAIRTLLPPHDRPAWEGILTLLRARMDLPQSAPPGADLAVRLQCWKDTILDRQGRWRDTPPVPATRGDTAALVGLLDDPRPTRRVEAHALPRPLGDMALDALCALWHVDWRWLVVDDPAVAAILPPRDPGEDPDLRTDLGDAWLWSQTAWTPERRTVIIAALTRWWHEHGAAGESPIISAVRSLPVNLWAETLAQLSATDIADAHLGDALAARLRAFPPPDPDGRMQQYAVQGVIAAAIRFPAHAGLSAALASWPASSWLAAVAAVRNEFAGDAAAFDRWLTAGMAHSVPPRRPRYSDGHLSPWGCFGLWAHHPTAPRLDALRRLLAGDIDNVRTLWVMWRVGSEDWMEDLDPSQQGHSDILSHRAQAIPCALALDGLRDKRPLSATARLQLAKWSEWHDMAELAKHLPDDARVCDWVAVRVQYYGTVLLTDPRSSNDGMTFLAAPIAQRDATIVRLDHAVERKTLTNLRAAGLAAPAAEEGVGVSDF